MEGSASERLHVHVRDAARERTPGGAHLSAIRDRGVGDEDGGARGVEAHIRRGCRPHRGENMLALRSDAVLCGASTALAATFRNMCFLGYKRGARNARERCLGAASAGPVRARTAHTMRVSSYDMAAPDQLRLATERTPTRTFFAFWAGLALRGAPVPGRPAARARLRTRRGPEDEGWAGARTRRNAPTGLALSDVTGGRWLSTQPHVQRARIRPPGGDAARLIAC